MSRKIKLNIAVFLVACVLYGCAPKEAELIVDYDASKESTESQTLGTTEYSGNEKIAVYVCGAVENPGVYYLDSGTIKADALALAGGLLADAARDYVNLAEKTADGERIYFPYQEELETGVLSDGGSIEADGRVNINTADEEQLMTLPGIGSSKARDIIKYREENGMYSCIEDIMNVPGIKEGVYNAIADSIVAK